MKRLGCLTFFMISVAQIYAIDGALIKTTDYSLKDKWNNIRGSSIPRITSCDTVFIKQYFFLTGVSWDYALRDDQTSSVEYSIKIFGPDTKIYFSKDNLPLINGKISNPKNVQMSEAILKMSFVDGDALGNYKIEMVITDRVSGKSKTINAAITLATLPAFNHVKVNGDEGFSKWMGEYYKNPHPENAMANYVYYSGSKLSDHESGFLPVFTIFNEVVKNNSYLLPQIIDCYRAQNLKTKVYLLYLLTFSGIDAKDFLNGLKGEEQLAYSKIKDNVLPDPYGTINDPSQLDMLWGTFLASGSYTPIHKLIQTLEFKKYEGFLDAFKTSKQTADDRQNAINNAIYNSLVWSITSNCRQHQLVKEYCLWALQFENLSEVQKEELKKLVK